MEQLDTVIIGAGQAGLATSYFLTQAGHEHVVLERAAQAASVWRNDRWDSFTTVTPNWVFRMPGAEYDGPEPEGFLPREEIVAHFDRYIERFRLPIRTNTEVVAVDAADGREYRVRTPDGIIAARNVVIATGLEQSPALPFAAANLSPSIVQLHSGAYRNPESLPDGAVLVVGSGQSGSQIAEELALRGRKVYLSTSGAGRIPRRYRGKDVITWLMTIGFFDLTPERIPPGMKKFGGIPHVSGTRGGHTLNLHQFARDGMTLLGHFRDAEGDMVLFAPDLRENLARADAFEANATRMIDGYIAANGLDVPPEELPRLEDGFRQPVIDALDLREAGIGTVIWATGYHFDFSLVTLPVFDADGFPIQTDGVASAPGLYFVGLPWMPALKTGSLMGFAERSKRVATHILETSTRPQRVAVAAS